MTSRDRWAAVLAALATLLTLWSLAPVVDGPQWQTASVLVVVVVLVSGLGLRAVRAPAVAVVAGQLVAGLVALTATFAGEEAVAGLVPGPDAVARMRELLVDGAGTVNSYSAPVPTSDGIAFLVAGGVLVVALLVDVLAVTLRSPAAAGLPLLGLYCVPAAVVQGGLSWRYFAAAALGWLLLLAHDASGRVLRWGRLLPRWGGTATPSRQSISTDTSALAATGRRLGAAAVALAVILPALLPGLSEGLLTNGGAGGGNSRLGGVSVINPVLTLRDNLTPRRDVEVLRYTTIQTDLAPLRIVTADRFDGESWKPGTMDVSRGQRASRGLPNPPGLTAAVQRTEYSMRIEVGDSLDQDFLPLPYPTRRVDVEGAWLYDAASLNVLGDGETVRGKTYTVDYLAVRPTAQQLKQAPSAPADTIQRYTRLPRSLPASVRKTARQVTAGTTSAYEQAMALQEWFRSKGDFTYSTEAPADSGGDAVADFLVDRKGFCIQFSSAMAVMARSLGIPARIGVGFLPGTLDGENTWSVKLTDAHAWPELYFEGVGWVRFEPTPASRTGSPPEWAQVQVAPLPGSSSTTPGAADAPAAGSTESLSAQQQKQAAEAQQNGGEVPPAAPVALEPMPASSLPWKLIGLGLVLLAAIAVTPASAALGRRRRRRAAKDAAARIEATWSDLHERVSDLGIELGAGSTPRQLDAELASAAALPGPSREALARVSGAVERSRYSRSGADEDLRDDVRSVLHAVAASRGRGDRLRAVALPRSGTARLLRAGDRLGGRLARVDTAAARRLHTARRPHLGRTPR